MQTENKVEESLCSSQNFCLKVSQDSSISDIENTNDDDEVIIISDSSSMSTGYVSKHFSKPKSTTDKYPITSNKIYVVDSSDSDSMSSGDEKYFQTWKASKMPNFISNYQSRKHVARKNKLFYTSDESSSSSTELLKQQTTTSTTTSSNCIRCSTEDNVNNTPEANIHSYRDTVNERNLSSNYTVSNSSNSSKSSNNNAQPIKSVSSANKIQNNVKRYLSQKDARNIIKNIKSTRIVYESPKVQNKIIYSSSFNNEEDEIGHPAISPKDTPKTSNIVVAETPLDSQSDIIPGSQVNLPNLYKTHVSKFLNTPQVAKDMGTIYNELSDRKKMQISEWLNENSSESQSDSSPGIVPASNRGDLSSGNSSLERLEMNYETPNNRGKIQQLPVSEKRITNVDCDKTPCFTVPRQTTINDFVQKTKSNTLEFRTPKRSHVNNSMFSMPTNSVKNTQQNVNITDCAEILDKLYGKSWRNKAEVLFPRSEPRKDIVPTKSRAVQTERKTKNKARLYISDSDDDDSNTSLKDLKLQNSPTKKNVQKNNKQKDSFINDGTSSGSGCESLYYTALTNPGISTSRTKPKPKVPPVAQRLNTICDSDTECEDDKGNRNKMFDVRRKMSFNNDESDDDSDTSEFDPGDTVPPKSTIKKNPAKTVRQTPKLNARSNSNVDNRKCSFLASLSDNIPVANAHPDAKKYRLDYKNNKENLCNYLYKLYNEKVFNKELPEDMSIEWNVRMRGTAGYCYNKKSIKTLGGVVRSSRLVLATKILDTSDRLRDTLIHEMCHAAAWLINGVSDGHGPFWTEWANKAMKAFPELPPIRRCHDYKIKTKFTYKCVGCGYSIGRHSKSLDIERKRCGHCYGKFELLINKTTKAGTVQVQTPKREVAGFALYVKENYNVVKKEHNIKHAEVMKILGQQFSAIKIAKKQETVENC